MARLPEYATPRYFCQKCCALLTDPPIDHLMKVAYCPCCGVSYAVTPKYPHYRVGEYLDDAKLGIKYFELPTHYERLMQFATRADRAFKSLEENYPPIRVFYEALQLAQKFVHFTTYGMSLTFLGALKLASMRILVRGMVSAASQNVVEELTTYKDDTPGLRVMLFDKGDQAPHQKLLIIDGLLAFKGSANLTADGWHKIGHGRELMECVTDLREVISLNNMLFSPVWAGAREDVKSIRMSL